MTVLLKMTLVTVAIGALGCSRLGRVPADSVSARADAFVAAGDTSSAIRHLEHAYLDADSTPAMHILLGELHRNRSTIEGRLRSQRTLERAQQLYPGNTDVLLALGRTYYAQTFYPDAQRCFRAALEIDANLCEPRYYLGRYYYDKWRRVNEHRDDLDRARGHLRDYLMCDSLQLDASRKLLRCTYVLDGPDVAGRLCERLLERFPRDLELLLFEATIAFDSARYDDAAAGYAAALDLCDAETRKAFLDLGPILPATAGERVNGLEPREQVVAERMFWAEMDPDPSTRVNERFLEHLHRVFLSDVYFSVGQPETRGWRTDRGRTFIKLGWPLDTRTSLEGNWNDGRMERWFYGIDGSFLEFVFVDERLNGNLRIPRRDDLKLHYLHHAPTRTEYESPSVSIPGRCSVVAFRDDEMTSSVYFVVAINEDSLRSGIDMTTVDRFHLRGILFDDDWMPNETFADTLWNSEIPRAYQAGTRDLLLARRLTIPFDYYHAALAFADAGDSCLALFRADADTYRYLAGGLTVSDILLGTDSGSGPHIVRNGVAIRANAGGVYSKGDALHAYVEVYSLGVVGGRSDYTIGYTIYPDETANTPSWVRLGRRIGHLASIDGRGRPVVSQTFHRQGNEHDAFEHIRINIDVLAAGAWRLVVQVTDGTTSVPAESETKFVLSPAVPRH